MLRLLHLAIAFLVLQPIAFSQSSPDFSITLEPDKVTVSPGDTATYTLRVSSINGFASPVFLQVVPLTGVSYQFSFGSTSTVTPTPDSTVSVQFTMRVLNDLDATYTITIRGTAGAISHTASATLQAQRPKDSFILTSSSQFVVLQAGLGASSAEIVVTAEPVGRYDSPVTLTLVETGALVTFEKTVLAPWESTRVTIAKVAGNFVGPGVNGVRIRGTGAGGASSNLSFGVQYIPDVQYSSGDQRVLFARLRVKGSAETSRIEDIQPQIDRAVEFYREVSYGQLRLLPDVLGGSYELAGTDAEYRSGQRITPQDALAAIDPHVDLRTYKFCVFFLDGWTPPAFAAPFETRNSDDGVVSFAAAYLPSAFPALTIHEMGHMFYLPDLYDVKREQFFFTYWDEMGEGAALFSGWSRLKLGWLPADQVADVQAGEKKSIALRPIIGTGDGIKLIRIPKAALPEVERPERPPFRPSFSGQRSYFLEARQRIGFDSSLPSDGVLLYSVDESIGSGSGPLRLVDRQPATVSLADAAFSPLPGDSSLFEDAANGLKISIFHRSDEQYDVDIDYSAPGKASLNVQFNSRGAATASTPGGEGAVQAGYVEGHVTSGVAPYAVAVLSLEQNGVVVSEVGVPVSRPTTRAGIFADYRRAVTIGGAPGTVDINTGFAAVNRGSETAAITITLRGVDGNLITSGTGTLAKNAHIAKFLDQLGDLFSGFSIPPSFADSTHFGTMELSSDQPISIVALRLTTNQRGESLMTTTPIADMMRPPAASAVSFPQFADGGGYTTNVFLLNTSSGTQSGIFRSYADDGTPVVLRMTDGTQASAFPYAIPPGGARVFQTDGSAAVPKVGWIELTPDGGQTAPAGAGLFQYSQSGMLVTQSGIPAAVPTTRARIYVDMSAGHDTALALANPGLTPVNLALAAFAPDGALAVSGSRTISLTGRAHSARFARELFPELPKDFRGVIDISAPSSFVALTLRFLVNARGDPLLTTFPVADLTVPAPVPVIFPQIANGGGYKTEHILLGAESPGTIRLEFLADDGTPLPVGH